MIKDFAFSLSKRHYFQDSADINNWYNLESDTFMSLFDYDDYVKDFFAKANDETMIVVLIEDIIAIDNLDEILTVDHIDAFYVAPGDLAQTMGYIGQPNHPEVLETIDGAIEKNSSGVGTYRRICSAGNVTSGGCWKWPECAGSD